MAKLSPLLLLLILGHVIFFTPTLSCPEYQKQALLHFKASIINATSSTESTLLNRLQSWSSSSDCCNWDRVSCSSSFSSRTVIALYLEDLILQKDPMVLTSTILTPLFRIKSLTYLDLYHNRIQGELPGDGFASLPTSPN